MTFRLLLLLALAASLMGTPLHATEALRIQLPAPASNRMPAAGHPLGLQVIDVRKSVLPGLNAKGEAIRIDNDLTDEIRMYVEKALAGRGWRTAPLAPGITPTLRIELVDLVYRADRELLRTTIATEAVVRAVAQKGPTTLKKTFRAKGRYQVPLTPSMEKDREMIQATLARALNAMLTDPQLDSMLR